MPFIPDSSFTKTSLSTYTLQRASPSPQTPPPSARLLVNIYKQGTAEKLVTFSQNVSLEGQNKWEELSIGLTVKEAVDIEVICENTDPNKAVFFDNIEVKVQSVPTTILVQENHYYPFGLGMRGLDWTLTPSQKEDKYSFQSKEKQTDFDLNISDFDARGFDYQTNRTWQIDPHAENYYSLSPYSFLNNNPLKYIDPDGKDTKYFIGSDGKKVDVKTENGKIILGNNATAELTELVGYANSAKSPIAITTIMKAGNNKSKIHVNIVNEVREKPEEFGYGLAGLHQAHDKDGKALNWNSEKGDFDGVPAYVEGKKGVYKEATITIFKGNISKFGGSIRNFGFPSIKKGQEATRVFRHEIGHNLDTEFIQDLRNKREGKPNKGIDAHQNIRPVDEKVYQEMKDNQ